MNKKRAAANKRNASMSTGPRTAAGKARSSLNATKHGAYGLVSIEGEDSGSFKRIVLDLLSQYNPKGFEATLLITEIAEVIWRKNRFKIAEAKAFETYSFYEDKGVTERGDLATAIAQDAGAYSAIPRCLAAEEILDRRLWRLFDRLKKIQSAQANPPVAG